MPTEGLHGAGQSGVCIGGLHAVGIYRPTQRNRSLLASVQLNIAAAIALVAKSNTKGSRPRRGQAKASGLVPNTPLLPPSGTIQAMKVVS
ncbi:hypothetical protein QU481_17530 [Crenobacter sp. SG2303]|uniref:Uncharacterized protein n=1 Tax=Crenobacter oryzisoli TaxID=3056844 RepID=A0ABT7XS92_9NEIS|nr:hypothetical protein [Crenobacter sp. SG2303]